MIGAWLSAIAAVVALSVLLDIIVPEGETNKYIKGIFALFTIFVILSPVVKLLDNEFTLFDFLDTSEGANKVDTAFVEKTRMDLLGVRESVVEKTLTEYGYKNVTIRIYLNYEENIDYVTADINNLIITENVSHININNDIRSIVANALRTDKERVIIYGSYTG